MPLMLTIAALNLFLGNKKTAAMVLLVALLGRKW